MSKVIVRRELAADLSGLADLHPLLQRVYAARQVTSSDEVDCELKGLLPYTDMLNIEAAAKRLAKAVSTQERILIVGDFDADGATSTVLAVSALRSFGAQYVRYLVPNRFAFGYGLTPEIVDVAKDQSPDLLITVDNGISSVAGVERAKELGIDVLITDHHLPGDHVPEGCIIVNPNQKGDLFSSKSLAGVGVIFYAMLALRSELKNMNWFEKINRECPNMAQYLDLVALGTVADVVPLDKNNRILVQQGLRRIRAGYTCAGILALLSVADKSRESISATDLGFAIGPRLNAAGRLEDMSLGISCLLSRDPNSAHRKAKKLDHLNKERRAIETQMKREAFDVIDQLNFDRKLPIGVCLLDETWHQGIIGLVAARVKEKVSRPTIAFAKVSPDTLKGSARSVKGLHIRDVLDNIAKANPHLLTKFGGHAMAAGLSIHPDNYEEFSKVFAEEVGKILSEDDLQDRIETDGELVSDDFTLDIAELLRSAGPWGQNFPEPRFDGIFQLVDQHIVGRRHLKMTLQIPSTDIFIDGIAFNVDADKWPNFNCQQAHVVYRLDINEFNGRRKLQLLVEDLEAL
jgi:single-stranded-DNA-specific exonuclease